MKYSIFLLAISSVANAATTYNKDAKPIFEKRCSSCHNDMWVDKNWLDYKTAFENRLKIKQKVWVERSMPVGQEMPQEERDTLKKWVDEGGKE